MTSMIDHDPPLPNRPKRDPYRGLTNPRPLDDAQVGQLVDSVVDPQRVTPTSATGYDARELDDVGRDALAFLLLRRAINPEYVAERMVVGRTRRGYVLGVTEYDQVDGELRVILGQPVTRQHLVPVELDELPQQWRGR